MSDVLYNRTKQFFISVPKNFDIEKDINILKESVKKSLKYLYSISFNKYYLKSFNYEFKKYYKVSDIVEVNLVNNNDNNKYTFNVCLK